MKNQSFKIKVPQPCHEKWSTMTAVEKGNFCKSCSKVVVDFTQQTDREIANFFQSSKGRLCGRFAPHQLNRPISLVSPKTATHSKSRALFLSGMLLASTGLAQQPTPTIQTFAIEENLNNEIDLNKEEPKTSLEKKITGDVLDPNGDPLAFANVAFYHQDQLIGGVETDFDGAFSFDVPIDFEYHFLDVVISYVGFENLRLYNIEVGQHLRDVAMPINTIISDEVCIVGMIVAQAHEQTLWQKTKNLWRKFKYRTPLQDWLDYREAKKEARVLKKLLPQNTQQDNFKFEEDKTEKGNDTTTPLETIIQTADNAAFALQKVSPNPFSTHLNIDLEAFNKGEIIASLFDELGQRVFVENLIIEQGQQNIQLDLSTKQLPSGSYILNLFHENGFQKSEVVILQK